MTEKQGGSDVRANTTVARPLNGGGPGGEYAITGHKWFFSIPMCDAFLVLAQADRRPLVLPVSALDAGRRAQQLPPAAAEGQARQPRERLSEVEFDGAWARLVGEEGAGIADDHRDGQPHEIGLRARQRSRDAGRLVEAIHHAAHRSAFGKLLVEQPLMHNVLADLCVESEAATISALRLARSYDESIAGDEQAEAFKRIANPVLKYWICKREPAHAAECLECFGGNGYVEESGMPRLLRQAPLNSIWEGSGNVQCLDVLRTMATTPQRARRLLRRGRERPRATPRLDSYASRLRADLAEISDIEARARDLVERMALALQGSLLLRFGDPAVADAFCSSRLGGTRGRAFGTLPGGTDFRRIIERHRAAP